MKLHHPYIIHKISEINKQIKTEALIFLKDQGGLVSGYRFDRFITIKLRQSSNDIAKCLQDLGLIEIKRINNSISIILTDKGNLEIEGIFNKVKLLFNDIVTNNNLKSNLSINLELPFLIIENENVKIVIKYLDSKNELDLNIFSLKESEPIDNSEFKNIEVEDNLYKILQTIDFVVKKFD